MKTHFPPATLLFTALVYLGFAIWLGFQPLKLLTLFGIESSTPQMLTEVRAFYGGIELGIAIAMILLWRKQLTWAGLIVGGIPIGCSACGRCIGVMLDGPSSLHLTLAAFEAFGAIACFFAAFVASRPSPNEASDV